MDAKLSRQERERMQLIRTVTWSAEELFRRVGYENATLDALAESSEYTKRTIYRYFVCKEDLYYAVMLKGHRALLDAIRAETAGGLSGHDKIQLAYKASYDYFAENGWLLDLIAQTKSIESRRDTGDLPYYKEYADCVSQLHGEIVGMFVAAHDDKSIRTDVDPRRLGVSSTFILNGLFHMLRLYGGFFTGQISDDKDELVDFTISFLHRALEPV